MKFLAPAHEVRKGWFTRFMQFAGLSLTAVVLLGVAISMHFAALYLAPTPHQLYHITWESLPHLTYDQSKLKNWDDWEHKFDDKIKTHEDAVKYANEMIASLDDPHTRLHGAKEIEALNQQAEGNFAGVGIQFELKKNPDNSPATFPSGVPYPNSSADGYPIVHKVIDSGPAQQAGVQDGEALISADGESFKDAPMDKLIGKLKDKAGTEVSVVVRSTSGVERTVLITRGIVEIPAVTVETYGNVGYIGLSGFIQDDTIDEMRAAFQELEDAEALVFDLRGNSGGRLDFAFTIASMFLDDGDIVKVKSRIPGMGYQEIITRLTKSHLQGVLVDPNGKETVLGEGGRQPDLSDGRPVVLLVDGGSASASEVLTGALMSNDRAEVVGTRTYGKGIGQSMLPFAGRTMLRITSFRFYAPDGTWAGDAHKNKIGFQPDHFVEKADNFDPLTDDDNQLQFALELLEEVLKAGN